MTERVIDIIKSIPPGDVMTYGDVARAAGYPGGARQVSRILHSCGSKYNLPWHRVVGKAPGSGRWRISLPEEAGGALQRALLEEEGISL